jgi:hypothetical protein
MIAELSLALASFVKDASYPWWASGAGPSLLFIWGVFLGLIGLAVLVNFLRSKE